METRRIYVYIFPSAIHCIRSYRKHHYWTQTVLFSTIIICIGMSRVRGRCNGRVFLCGRQKQIILLIVRTKKIVRIQTLKRTGKYERDQ